MGYGLCIGLNKKACVHLDKQVGVEIQNGLWEISIYTLFHVIN